MNPQELERRIRRRIVDVPGWPRAGIVFKDLTPLYQDPETFAQAVEAIVQWARGRRATAAAAIEARGFLVGAAVAERAAMPLALLRKPGKLPRAVHRQEYELEYGKDALEMHRDALAPGARVVVVDDVLATGGTAGAAGRLVAAAGGEVAGYAFLIELAFLGGRAKLPGVEILSLVVER